MQAARCAITTVQQELHEPKHHKAAVRHNSRQQAVKRFLRVRYEAIHLQVLNYLDPPKMEGGVFKDTVLYYRLLRPTMIVYDG